MTRFAGGLCTAGAILFSITAFSAAAENEKTYTVKKGDLRAEVSLDAVVAAGKSHPLMIDPKAWAAPSVVTAIPHGKRVRKGELLLTLDALPLREEIEATEKALYPAKVAREQAEAALRNLEKTSPLQIADAKRALGFAAEALDYYEKTGKEQAVLSAKNALRRSEQALSYAEEELNQLTKMYEADDLTEETEEIIITRARNDVEASRIFLNSVRLGTERALKIEIPRQHEALKNAKVQAELGFQNARSAVPLALEAKRAEAAKLVADENALQKKIGKLKADLPLVELRAPADGIVGYGASENGKWATADAIAKKLVPGGKIAAKEVIFTLVENGGVHFRTSVPEDKLSTLRQGAQGVATPVFDPLARIPVRLSAVDFAPQPAGGFLARVDLAKGVEAPARLTAGMNVKLAFVTVNEKDVITVPVTAIRHGEKGAEVSVGGNPVPVRLGATDGQNVVVLSGLKEGDKIDLP